METNKSVFSTLNAVNCNEHTEKKKQGSTELTYLSWAWAWAEVKKLYPDASYTIYKDELSRPYMEDPELGLMCYTNVTIEGQTHEMWLPVMNGANKAMRRVPYKYTVYNSYTKTSEEKTVEAATMFDVNKTIMRCLVKNLAMFGLGLYIYAGEDLPEDEQSTQPAAQPAPTAAPVTTDMDIAKIVAQANACKTADEVMKIYNDHKELWSNDKFSKPIIAIGKAKREQEKGGAA
jgi:hypothetical protein